LEKRRQFDQKKEWAKKKIEEERELTSHQNRQQLILELVRQNKSPKEIEAYLKLLSSG
jgi:hypothetical protein